VLCTMAQTFVVWWVRDNAWYRQAFNTIERARWMLRHLRQRGYYSYYTYS